MKKYIMLIVFVLFSFTLVSCEKSDDSILKEVLNSIEMPGEVTGNLDLKTEYVYKDKTVNSVWATTASSVITNDGVITVQVNDQKVTLLLTLTLNSSELKESFDITVKGSDDFLLLFAVIRGQVKFSTFELSSDLTLPTEYEIDGKTVTASWLSSKQNVLENNGKIHQIQVNVDVNLEVTLTLNNAVRIENFTFTVLQDSSYLPVNWWHTVDVWTDSIDKEVATPVPANCFPGAVYRKVVSSRDNWLGIEGLITIPEFTPDPVRFDSSKMSYYLDNASIYMGGNAQYESDIGLTWSIGYPSSDNKSLTQKGIAFRPFWRYITKQESNDGTTKNIYKNANVSSFEFYYFPGDKVRMSVYSPKVGYLQMRIELVELTTIEKYVEQRNNFNLGEDFNRLFSTPLFPSEGMGGMKTEFKRVNAIDQVANENKATINTNSKVENAIWHSVYLYRNINGELHRVPMTERRSSYMTCPVGKNENGDFSNTFSISYDGVNKADGGEVVTLNPNNGTGRLYNTSVYIPRDKKEEWL
jgi:hypothetical protein